MSTTIGIACFGHSSPTLLLLSWNCRASSSITDVEAAAHLGGPRRRVLERILAAELGVTRGRPPRALKGATELRSENRVAFRDFEETVDFTGKSASRKKKTGCRGRSKLGETRVSGLGVPDTHRLWVSAGKGLENALHCELTATAAGLFSVVDYLNSSSVAKRRMPPTLHRPARAPACPARAPARPSPPARPQAVRQPPWDRR